MKNSWFLIILIAMAVGVFYVGKYNAKRLQA
jgi:hypothetical protein